MAAMGYNLIMRKRMQMDDKRCSRCEKGTLWASIESLSPGPNVMMRKLRFHVKLRKYWSLCMYNMVNRKAKL